MWNCNECREENYDYLDKCWNCGSSKDGLYKFKEEEISNKEDDSNSKKYKSIIVTTASSLEGYSIAETIDIITSECVFYPSFLDEVSGEFGVRSATRQVLRDARKLCLAELRREAFEIGANAVVAVKLDYSEFTRNSMLFLVASGTAVKVIKKTN